MPPEVIKVLVCMALTDTFCKKIKPIYKNKRYVDSGGLYLEVSVKGGKYWRVKYRFHNKEKRLSLGTYPTVSLKDARQGRDKAKELLSKNIDPSLFKKKERYKDKIKSNNTFETIALEWHSKQTFTAKHSREVLSRLKANIFPDIGNIPIQDITSPMLLEVLKKIEARGALDIAKRVRQTCGQIFRYAIAIGKTKDDITISLKGALKTTPKRNYNHFTEQDLPGFFAKLEKHNGNIQTKLAIEFTLHTFARTGEVRYAVWNEINYERKEWHIPAPRMKMRDKHIVPLTDQVLSILERLQVLNLRNSKYIFPHVNDPYKCMSENTMLFTLHDIGYHLRATIHGFRATASTILNENGFKPDVIEKQLAHAPRNSVRASYNHAEYLQDRKEMMRWWSDFLTKLKLHTPQVNTNQRTESII
ncbi:MAG: P4-like integrase [Candidatus Xenolissoclinum pacificiensis L6]|uniref:P4-like integrase n=1 Tax=Candidatus Xenolissoclinum pacificiensis L6 TaxID=1401685 RepID=W2UZJ4_9RICK|nr:MAG: P4-like integrase [Candidatus Xenolissoclinum pacificiensis L6]